MKILKTDKRLVDEGYRYKIDGDLMSVECIDLTDLDKPIYVTGFIKAGGFIEAGEYIEAGGFITAGESHGIAAGLYITANTTITAGLKIFAGVCTWLKISDEDKTITCTELNGGATVEYGILNIIEEAESSSDKIITLNGKKYKLI